MLMEALTVILETWRRGRGLTLLLGVWDSWTFQGIPFLCDSWITRSIALSKKSSCSLYHSLSQDFIVKGTLSLKCLEFCVLDEANEMLNMRFLGDVELILGSTSEDKGCRSYEGKAQDHAIGRCHG